MPLRPLLASLALVTLALAGCSGGSPDKGLPDPEFGVQPTDTTGIIRGVLVDQAVRPLSGVNVVATSGSATQEMRSTDDGLFAFDRLAPGTWFLSARKAGYFEARTSVEVAAGEAEPPIVKMLLTEDVANRPYNEQYVWRGFIECSAGVPEVGSVNPCFVLPTSSNTWEQNLTGQPMHVQAEMVWEGTTAVGQSFWISAYVEGEDLVEPDDYAEAQGTSPLVLSIGPDLLASKGVGDEPLAFRVFPGIDQPTAFLQQGFEVYIHVFYGYEPPAGWQFSVDQSVPPPQ